MKIIHNKINKYFSENPTTPLTNRRISTKTEKFPIVHHHHLYWTQMFNKGSKVTVVCSLYSEELLRTCVRSSAIFGVTQIFGFFNSVCGDHCSSFRPLSFSLGIVGSLVYGFWLPLWFPQRVEIVHTQQEKGEHLHIANILY